MSTTKFNVNALKIQLKCIDCQTEFKKNKIHYILPIGNTFQIQQIG